MTMRSDSAAMMMMDDDGGDDDVKIRPRGDDDGKNIVYHFPNKINRNMLRVSLTEKMLKKRLTRVAIPNPDLHP